MSSQHPSPEPNTPYPPMTARKWLGLFVLWSLPTLPWYFLLSPIDNPFDPEHFRVGGKTHTLAFFLLRWYFWVPMSVWVARWGRRFPLFANGAPQIRYFGLHFALSAATITLFHAYDLALSLAFHGDAFPTHLFIDPGFLKKLAMDWRPGTIYWLVLFATLGWQTFQINTRLQVLHTRTHLMALKSQVHPHFLFNTLHSVSTLMAEDVDAARKVIAQLSDFLRVTLDEPPGDEVPLEDELNFVRLYLEIEHVRFADRLKVELDIDPASRQAAVPHLLLLPLVENAITHGLGGRSDASLVRVASRIEGDDLILEIDDDGPGLGAGTTVKEGIGLGTTRARLGELYFLKADIELTPRPGGGTRCSVRLPYRLSSEKR